MKRKKQKKKQKKKTKALERKRNQLCLIKLNTLINKLLVFGFEESNTRVSGLLEQIHRPGSEALFRFIYEFGRSTQHVNTHLHTHTHTHTQPVFASFHML